MPNRKFSPENVLGDKITQMSRQELCQLVSRLCSAIAEEVGARGFRGGVYPENISLDAQGEPALGAARQSDWDGQELQFIAPELYWHGQRSAASDVYSLGLLMYYAVSGGKLPYEGECEDPQLRRMGGEDIVPPANAGRRLSEIIARATRFKAADRYQTLEELRIMLDSLVNNLYLGGTTSAEAIFAKNDDDLNDIERIMVGIIERGGDDAPAEPPKAEPKPAPAQSEPEQVRVYEPAPKKKAPKAPPAEPPKRQPIPILTEEKNPELEPVVPCRKSVTPAVQYTVGGKREDAEPAPKGRKSPVIPILIICAAMVVTAIIVNAMLKDFVWNNEPDVKNVSPSPGVSDALGGSVIRLDTPVPADTEPSVAPTDAPAAEPSYQVIKEDVSWTQAQEKCAQLGGHLAVITSREEFDKLTAMAEEAGVSRIWIGCHRENGSFVWENGASVDFYNWAEGEPSVTDSYDGAAEDYVMLWNDGGWVYNDSRNDPAGEFPEWYSGTIGYICQFD